MDFSRENLSSIMGKIKLLFLTQTLGLGGAEQFNADLLGELQAHHEFEVIAATTNEIYATQLRQKKLTVLQTKTIIDVIGDWKGLLKALVLWPVSAWEYYKILKSVWPQFILMSGFGEKLVVTPLARWLGIPVVWIEFGPLDSVLDKFGGVPRKWYGWCMKWPVKIVTSSRYSANLLIKNPGLESQKVVVIRCGRALDKVKIHRLKISARPPKTPTIVCVSRLEPGKGQDILIDAFAQVHKEIPTAMLEIVGEGDFLSILQRQAQRLGFQKQISFLGRVDDSLVAMAKATVCVFPSLWPLEGFGLVLIEAMAVGQPIVAFDRDPTPEIVVDEKTALLVPVQKEGANTDTVKKLAETLVALLNNKIKAKKIGQAAEDVFWSRFTIQSVAGEYTTLFRKLLKS
jgi:glycosyltransferase involved in cell wall biosynthesis